ncbi:ligase-associated DNA damage response endonuclease PdeM [Fretibacter rubidus]|uniref:ligase-associated DNA damage response endonuclease PdeM n=1 Tax=Fretibacter rubidus TaxID=570162 RepID=UPI00352A768F
MPNKVIHQTQAGEIIFDGRKVAFLPKSKTLLVADLHFEKGSFLQMNGHAPLPAYDTQDTINALAAVISDYEPSHVVALGDSFHDIDAGLRLSEGHSRAINDMIKSLPEFTWILGNHDPDIPQSLLGQQQDHLTIDGFLLTHLPTGGAESVNICGHLHPKAKIKLRRRHLSKPCFACSDDRIIMPSFGTYTGGLWVTHTAITDVLNAPAQYYATDGEDIFQLSENSVQAYPSL